MDDDNQEAREFLKRVCKKNQTLATLADAGRDELVIVAVRSKVKTDDPDKPAYKRVLVLDKNESLNGVLTQDSRHKFGQLRLEDPCLRFNPPIIDEYWPDRHPADEDPELAERYDPPHFPH